MMIKTLLLDSTKRLSDSPTPRLDVEVLLCYLLKVNRAYLHAHSDKQLNAKQIHRFKALLQRRQTGEPIAYITGHQEFWSLDFLVNEHVLIPRPETELLVEIILQQQAGSTLLELGTGSGAIAIAVASERPDWHITATDHSTEALNVAQENAKRLETKNIKFILSDWFASIPKMKFDIIVSNPPYIAESDSHLQEGDVRFEPRSALVSGEEGLDAIRLIASKAKSFLNVGGMLLLEHGFDQGKAVREIFEKTGYCHIQAVCDLAAQERVTIALQRALI